MFLTRTAAVATLLFVIRLGDGITDVLMRMVADRTATRWGKFRLWILWTALPFGVALVSCKLASIFQMENYLSRLTSSIYFESPYFWKYKPSETEIS